MATSCATHACDRHAFDGHRHCCRECKTSRGTEHGHRCMCRQDQHSHTAPADSGPSSSNPVPHMKSLVNDMSSGFSSDEKKRWIWDLLRAFHPDRHPSLKNGTEVSAYLTEELSKLTSTEPLFELLTSTDQKKSMPSLLFSRKGISRKGSS